MDESVIKQLEAPTREPVEHWVWVYPPDLREDQSFYVNGRGECWVCHRNAPQSWAECRHRHRGHPGQMKRMLLFHGGERG